jgi:cytochrome c556
MTSTLPLTVLVAGFCLAAGLAVAAGEHDHHSAATDTRQPIVLEPGERAMILTEMRAFLSGVQSITAGMVRNDMKTVATAARALGRAATHEVPPGLMQKLPQDFRRQGFAVHADFDQIALDAEQLGDGAHSLKQLSETLAKCVACHAAYQLAPAPAATDHAGH